MHVRLAVASLLLATPCPAAAQAVSLDQPLPANRRAGPELVNLGLAGHGTGKFVGDFLLFGIDEAHQGGADLNGDGDALDQVYHLLRP